MLDEVINRCVCGGQADWILYEDSPGDVVVKVQCKRCELQMRKHKHDLGYNAKNTALVAKTIWAWNHSMQKSKK